MDTSILEDIGFTRSEIAVYLALLEIGESTSGPLIEKSGLQSSVVHRTLKNLIQKGFISFITIGKDNHYQAASPKYLLNYLENKKKQLQDILPTLELKETLAKEKNKVEMFIGKKAIFAALIDNLTDVKKGDEYCSFSLIEPHDDKEIVLFYNNYNLRRREKNLNVKVLVNKKVRSIYEKNYTKELLKKANVRYTDFIFPQGMIILKDTVSLLNWAENPLLIKITNKQMAEQYKQFFLSFYNKEKDAYE